MLTARRQEIAAKYLKFSRLPINDDDRNWVAMGVTIGEVGDLVAEADELRAALKEAAAFVPSTEDDLLGRLSALVAA